MKEYVRTILDYPVKGIKFRDITTLLQDSKHFKNVINLMTNPWRDSKIDAILSIESRGFIMAGAIAYNLNTAFIPLRKPDKLPGETFKVSYTLEYGSTEMHIHKDALDNHTNLLIIDDLLATGGTALAAIDLINKFKNKKIVGAGFIINLPELQGEKKLLNKNIKIHSLMEF
ncbi:MAG: Adenine phosphoribosyltransferase [Alphaproteobacteria bacterium MarineAlpha5_Bin8]|nr:MAG: Adenine phosphoribosyltransferase [Alphaproteobacteria bacterium MarineAlpha5_Bin7]PPR44882.1 MAG: Adenine phosphoribosyltransferase [Alphaproteobacteria bacterium MarineAlpha5_Bin8]PPR53645.1 MAG: Adenine phosphoribosyltransferase [Alphaproteobacteria bacterium MarineAlpha5_Bin6]|tara:strand:+ start:1913 stop:2428 length:516 start_codon:yes stop_codon:yes gene_type:complete